MKDSEKERETVENEKIIDICHKKFIGLTENVGKRKILIWGACESGKIVKGILGELGYSCHGFIDKTAEDKKEFCGLPVNTIEILNVDNYYVIVGIAR